MSKAHNDRHLNSALNINEFIALIIMTMGRTCNMNGSGKKNLYRIQIGKHNYGRPKLRWEGNVKEDLWK